MELEEIINTWYKLAARGHVNSDEASTYFFKFIAVWVAFNALYASRYSNEGGDREQIMRFAGESFLIDNHRRLVAHDSAYNDAVNVLKERGVTNLRNRVRRRIDNNDNLNEVLNCIYQVRCNLFHGGKAPGDPRDERLVQASYTIISKLIVPVVDLSI